MPNPVNSLNDPVTTRGARPIRGVRVVTPRQKKSKAPTKSAHQKDDEADQQHEANASAAVIGTAKIETTAAEEQE
jgi:hypothetical protein